MKRLMQPLLSVSVLAGVLLMVSSAWAENPTQFDIYGFVMTDGGYNRIAIDPQWFDVQRPTKLPAFKNQFGDKGSTFYSVRQSRFGVKSSSATGMGDLKTQFEFEMFGVGVDAGQTTIRLRHAYGELGQFGAGQTWSPFMDIDVFPNTVEYWGPPGMAFFRNVQFRWMPIQGDTRMTIALERPGASGDQGVLADRVEFTGVTPRFPYPDLSAEYRKAFSRGYLEFSGIVRRIEWEDNNPAAPDFSDHVIGWGAHVSSNIKLGAMGDVLRLSALRGEGIENYMNDAPVDVAPKFTGNPLKPVEGAALPVTGVSAFLDHVWNANVTSSIGYSEIDIDNSSGQAPDAFKRGQYALANVAYLPVPAVMVALEGGWIRRENNSDGFAIDNTHVQVSAKYNFNFNLGGGQ